MLFRSQKWLAHTLPLVVGVMLVALPCAVPATAAAATPAPGKGWVGRVSGTQAFVGLVLRGHAVTAYVCDGRRVGRWYTGPLRGRRATLRDSQGHRLTVRIAGGNAIGRVDLPGHRAARFAARRARGKAGLFRRRQAGAAAENRPARQTVTGWIRLNNGRVKGLAASRTLRAELYPPRTTVLFRAASSTTTSESPDSGPRLDERLVAQSGPCDPVPRPAVDGGQPKPFKPGPTCGLPAAGMSIGVRRTAARLRSRQAGFKLSNAAIERLMADLPRIYAKEEARVLKVTGLPSLPPTLPTPEQRRRLDLIARAVVRDSKLTAAAAAYRRSPTAANAAAYLAFAGKYLDPTLGLVDRPEVAVREFIERIPISATSEQTLTGPWAVFEFEELEGPDAEVTPTEQFGVLGDALHFGNLARAGFFSRADVHSYAVLDIDVPPGAREVEIETVAHRNPQLETRNSCLAGSASARTGMTIMVHAIDPDGTFHIFDGAPVDGVYFHDEFSQAFGLPLGICPTAPPVPEPPFFESLEEFHTLRISDPPAAGGHYLMTIGSSAFATTLSDGQAWADHAIDIKRVIVRTRF